MSNSPIEKLESAELYDALKQSGVSYYTGVPDSITGPFSNFLNSVASENHDIATNEGNAVGMAIGYHAATGKLPAVYMQNSGLNNALDPLTSLADSSVYSVPMLLLIGWRGEPGITDEPQHEKQGAMTQGLLRQLGISAIGLSGNAVDAKAQVFRAADEAVAQRQPQALVLKQGILAPAEMKSHSSEVLPSRERAIGLIADSLEENDAVIAGIGKTGRELFEYREERVQQHDTDLLVVGGMGHASSIALTVAAYSPERKFYCLDGDGSLQMHMGALATIGSKRPSNLYHIVFNNGTHDSVGGQIVANPSIDLPRIALACGYNYASSTDSVADLEKKLKKLRELTGPVLLDVRVCPGARSNLGRPSIAPAINYGNFSSFIRKDD